MKKLTKKSIKKVTRRKNPDVFDIHTQLENLITDNIKVQIRYKYGSFFGYLEHSISAFTINIKDKSVFFVFDSPDVKEIIKSTKLIDNPTIILK